MDLSVSRMSPLKSFDLSPLFFDGEDGEMNRWPSAIAEEGQYRISFRKGDTRELNKDRETDCLVLRAARRSLGRQYPPLRDGQWRR